MGEIADAFTASRATYYAKVLATFPVAAIVSFLEGLGYTVTPP